MTPLYPKLLDKPGAYRNKVPVSLAADTLQDLSSIMEIVRDNSPITPNLFGDAPWEAVKDRTYITMATDASGTMGLGAHAFSQTFQRQWHQHEQ